MPVQTFYPTHDTYIDDRFATATNYGQQTTIKMGVEVTGQRNHGVLKFDLSSIPANAEIRSAQLKFKVLSNYGLTSTVSLGVMFAKVIKDWQESVVTGNDDTAGNLLADVNDNTGYVFANSNTTDLVFNVKYFVERWIRGEIPNYGLESFSDADLYAKDSTIIVGSAEHADVTKRPYLQIDYITNNPPSPPSLTSPNGGETISGSHLITWNLGNDLDGDALSTQIDLSTNNGSTWKTIVNKTSNNATSYSYNFLNEIESSVCRLRIRHFDGKDYSAYDTSDGVFTTQHNVAPNAPNALSPSGVPVNRNESVRLSWKHNDPNSNDKQSKFNLQWRVKGNTAWNVITELVSREYLDFPSGTFPLGEIEWQVQTYDQYNLASPWSVIATFVSADKPPKPVMLSPLNNTVVPVARPTIQWSSSEQTAYKLRLMNDTLTTELWTTGEVNSTNKAHTVGYDLVHGQNYNFVLSVRNTEGIWSDDVTTFVSVSYTPPATPSINLFDGGGYITVFIANLEPTGTQPEISHNDLFKRIDNEWVRIANGLPSNGSYRDYAVASGKQYEYKVRAYSAENETMSESTVYTKSITFTGVWIHDPLDAESSVHHFELDGNGRSSSRYKNGQFMQFAGRKKPVFERSVHETQDVSVTLILLNGTSDAESLSELFDADVVCYRDGRGRLLFGVMRELPLNDESYGAQTVNINIIETDYNEGV